MIQWVPPVTYVDRADEMMKFVRHVRDTGECAMDTETTGLDRRKDHIVLWSASPDEKSRYCFSPNMLKIWDRELAPDPDLKWYFTNQTFDFSMLANSGVRVPEGDTYCTLAMDWLHDENRQGRHGLKETMWDYHQLQMKSFKDTFGTVKRNETIPERLQRGLRDDFEKAVSYASLDAYATLKVFRYLKAALEKETNTLGQSLWDYFVTYEMPFTRVLHNCCRRGIMVDVGYLDSLSPAIQVDIDRLEKQLVKVAGKEINPRSNPQLRELFFTKLGLKPIKMTSGGDSGNRQPSTDEECLQIWADDGVEAAVLLMQLRELSKFKGTYVDGMRKWTDQDGRIHATMTQHVTVTGRLSSVDPNLQNLPRPDNDKYVIRQAFMPKDGHVLVISDYEQLEMRLLAHFSEDPNMIGVINRGWDIHSGSAALMYDHDYDELIAAIKKKKAAAKDSSIKLSDEEKAMVLHRQDAKCVHPTTLVWSDGLRPMESFRFGEDPDTFLEISSGIQVATGRRESAVAVKATYNGGEKELLQVVARRGVLTCSHNHRFLLADGTLRKAEDLMPGDRLAEAAVPQLGTHPYPHWKRKMTSGIPASVLCLDHDVSYFAGLFLGDGCRSSDHAYGFAHGPCGSSDASGYPYSSWQDDLYHACTRIGLDSVRRHNTSLYIGSRHTGEYLEALDLIRNSKKLLRVPSWILQAGREAALHFLGGLIDTDGTVDKRDGDISLTTKDGIFAGQLAFMARACGLKIGLDPGWNSTYRRWYFRLKVMGSDGPTLRSYIRHPGKRDRIRRKASHKQLPDQVMTVIPVGPGPCVDLELADDDHLYLANGLITHNTIGFALNYGEGPKKLAKALDCTVDEAKAKIAKYFQPYPHIKNFIDDIHAVIADIHFVETILNRPRRFPEMATLGHMSRYHMRGSEKANLARNERQSVNSVIQGSAADVAKAAMLKCELDPRLRSLGVQMLLQVHDELVFEVPEETVVEAMPIIRELMEHPLPFDLLVPLNVDMGAGYAWSSAKA